MYKRFKTTTGHRYTMRVCEDEVRERRLYHIAIVLVPFLSSALMMAIWLKGG